MSKTLTKEADTRSSSWRMMFAVALAAGVMFAPDFAMAAKDTPFGAVFCTVTNWFTGNTGKGLATIAITIIGIGALLGKVSWGMALIVGTGVAIVFGAAAIVDAMGLTGDGGDDDGGATTGCNTKGWEVNTAVGV